MSKNEDINLLETLNKQEYDLLLQYAKENQEDLMEKWFNADQSSFSELLRYENLQLKHLKHHLEESSKEDAIFHLGMLMGTIETLDHLFYEKEQEVLTANIYGKQISSIEHLKEVMQLLETYGGMNCTEMYERLNLEEADLLKIIDKAVSVNLITSSGEGECQLYELTDTGRYLSRQL